MVGDADFDHPTPAPSEMLKRMFPAYDETYVSDRSVPVADGRERDAAARPGGGHDAEHDCALRRGEAAGRRPLHPMLPSSSPSAAS